MYIMYRKYLFLKLNENLTFKIMMHCILVMFLWEQNRLYGDESGNVCVVESTIRDLKAVNHIRN